MNEMRERVARAIWERRRKKTAADYPDLQPLEEFGDGTIPRLNGVFEEAQDAIAAMREPTPPMFDRINALERKWKTDLKLFDVTGFCALGYQAMIDEALR